MARGGGLGDAQRQHGRVAVAQAREALGGAQRAMSGIAIARSGSADTRDPARLAALAAMDETLARQDLAAAVQAWRQARELALRSRGWRGPAEAADAELRLAVAADRLRESKPTARELFLVTLFRARATPMPDPGAAPFARARSSGRATRRRITHAAAGRAGRAARHRAG